VEKEANECFVHNIRNQQMFPSMGPRTLRHVPVIVADIVSNAFQFYSMIFVHIA
jgi:hypothetical protein